MRRCDWRKLGNFVQRFRGNIPEGWMLECVTDPGLLSLALGDQRGMA